MTPKHARYAVCAFVTLSACVAGNIMLFQDNLAMSRGAGLRAQQSSSVERAKRAASEPQLKSTETVATHAQPTILNAQVLAPTPVAAPRIASKGPLNDITPTVTGADAPDVAASIQRELQTRGYEPGTPDGVAGAVTRAAIMAWEHDHGLAITGEPTEAIMKAIVLGVSAPIAALITAQWQALPKDRRGRTELLIRTTQLQLSALGYNPGKASGRINEDTERSIREFEVDQNLTQSGRISGPLVARLIRLTGAGRTAAPR